jgi:cycloartenol synthase
MWKFVSAGDSNGDPYLVSLNGNKGRQTWVFDPTAGSPEERARVEDLRAHFTANRHTQHHSSDELLRLQCADKIAKKSFSPPSTPLDPKEPVTAERVKEHLLGALSYYECLQQDDGHFPGDYGGPMFLMPGLIITLYTCGVLDKVLSPEHQKEMVRYLQNHQNEDGGFGLHIEGGSTMFGTALRYA